LPDPEGAPGVVNTEFTAQTSAKSSEFTGEMYWGTGDHDFYAYYPYAQGSETSDAVPVSLASEQTQSGGDNSDHIGDLDFMVATPVEGIDPGDEGDETSGINFRYNHVFTLLEFRIINGHYIYQVRLSGDIMLSSPEPGTIDLTQATPSVGAAYDIDWPAEGTSNEVILTLTNPVNTTSDYETTPSIYAMVLPRTGEGDIIIAISTVTGSRFVVKETPGGGFDRGKKYVVELNATEDFTEGVSDIDGNEYETVICYNYNREWMAENLRTTKYKDGTSIPTDLTDAEWENTTEGAYSVYPHTEIDDFSSEAEVLAAYGALYNWYAVDDSRGLCPTGWRVSSDGDWTDLLNSLGAHGTNAGNALKSCRQVNSPFGGDCATDEHPRWDSDTRNYGWDHYEFSALPGGCRSDIGSFSLIGRGGRWWTSTEASSSAWQMSMASAHGNVTRISFGTKAPGLSVRCVRDIF
ncbi:MAG: hypothetical protein EA408_00205, partial [Marinilabiliales bacterium]